MPQTKTILSKEELKVAIQKGFLFGDPEGGMHVHVLDRNSKTTQEDGAHRHVFVLPGGGVIFTEEDGQHVHPLESVDANLSDGFDDENEEGSPANHTHRVLYYDGADLETEIGGAHEHELMVETSGFDGLHTHELVLPDGTRLESLTPGEWTKLTGYQQPELPKSPPASGYTRTVSRAIYEALRLIGDQINKENEQVAQSNIKVSNTELLALAALGVNVNKEQWTGSYGKSAKKKKRKQKRRQPVTKGIKREWEEEGIEESELLSRVSILKSKSKSQIVYGVVLEPETVDFEGDIISKDEIAKAMHFFMKKSRVVGYRHKDVANGATVVECFQAPQDLVMGSQVVKEGSWVLGVHVEDKKTWNHIESGVLNSFSVGGWGLRRPER